MSNLNDILKMFSGDGDSEEDYIKTLIRQIKEYDYSEDFKMIEKQESKKTQKFFDGFLDVYISIFYIDEEDMENTLPIFVSHILFLRYKINKQKDKLDKKYSFGYTIGMNMISPVLQYAIND